MAWYEKLTLIFSLYLKRQVQTISAIEYQFHTRSAEANVMLIHDCEAVVIEKGETLAYSCTRF